ncbi:MAG: VCBS repeat-containing protein [Flavobacteriia bacterium]|nr:VCBS repeat-containing protein [Flavobacteriia bacterium]
MRAQIFTKVTNSVLVQDSSNHHSTAWGDYDNDGDLDLYVSNWFSSVSNPFGLNFLYQNSCNNEFTKVRKIPTDLVTDFNNKYEVNWIDYDADGDLDLYFTNALYENNGNGTFSRVNKTITNLPDYTISNTGGTFNVRWGNAAWLDYDNDGKLDVYFGRKELYHNNGLGDYDIINSPSFSNMNRYLRGESMTVADANNDGLMDIFMCSARSQFGSNKYSMFYQNAGNGVFNENNSNGLTNHYSHSYGCTWGDIDNDLDLDVWLSINLGNYDKLLINDGTGNFTPNLTDPVANILNTNQAGASFADFDNDGDLDLVVPSFSNNFVYQNDGQGNFVRLINEVVETDVTPESYSASWSDYDNDGDLDLFIVTAFGDPNDLFYTNNIYQNNTSNSNWIKFDLDGVQSNRQAIGTRVYVKALINGTSKWQMREVNLNGTGGGESGGASGHVVHFGLGDATTIDSIKVFWPASGITQYFTNVASNQFLKIMENVNALSNVEVCRPDLPLLNPAIVEGRVYSDVNSNCVYDNGIDYPIANTAVYDSLNGHYAYTNDEGLYQIELPSGNFNLQVLFKNDLFQNSTCLLNGKYNIIANLGDLFTEKDFPLLPSLSPCSGNFDLNITSNGLVDGPCPDGIIMTSPCPLYPYEYCFQLTNNSTQAALPNGVLNIDFPTGFSIVDEQAIVPELYWNTNHAEIIVPTALAVGATFEVCITIMVDANFFSPYVTTASYGGIPLSGNLIVNGGFEGGDVGFSSDYTPDLVTTGSLHDRYAVGSNANYNSVHTGTANEGTNFLFADGSITSNTNVWCQAIAVNANTFYQFSGDFCNTLLQSNSNPNYPNLAVTINGIQSFNTGPIPQDPDIWLNDQSFVFCSDENQTIELCILDLNTLAVGNDFGIDDLSLIELEGNTAVFASLTQNDMCSCDPNDKLNTPVGCGPNGNIEKDQELTYHIRFQNEGSGPAHDVLLRDALDEDLDLSTLQILSSSHTISSVQIIPNNTLIVKFNGIELPPKSFSEEESKGFFTFKIKAKTNLVDGTPIQNQTGIYFDLNEVVLTNSTLNTLVDQAIPEANFTYNNDCSALNTLYDFYFTGSENPLNSYTWSFEDGNPLQSNLKDPSGIMFSSTGYKEVYLEVDKEGCKGYALDTIEIKSYYNNIKKKVQICHNGKLIEVNENALAAHLAHGDCVGECEGLNLNKSIQFVEKNEKNLNSIDFLIYPNPSTGLISIQGNKLQSIDYLEVLNLQGQVVFNTKLHVENVSKQIDLDLNSLHSGVYLLQFDTKKEKLIYKINIQK